LHRRDVATAIRATRRAVSGSTLFTHIQLPTSPSKDWLERFKMKEA
jgi:hypothetical protein